MMRNVELRVFAPGKLEKRINTVSVSVLLLLQVMVTVAVVLSPFMK